MDLLRKRRTNRRLIVLYNGLNGKVRIPTDDLIPKKVVVEINTLWHFRYHQLAKKRTKAFFSTDYQGLECLISSAEMSDDRVFKFASLGLISVLAHPPPGEVLSIWRVISKPFRFRFHSKAILLLWLYMFYATTLILI